jgi:hypothetical protein
MRPVALALAACAATACIQNAPVKSRVFACVLHEDCVHGFRCEDGVCKQALPPGVEAPAAEPEDVPEVPAAGPEDAPLRVDDALPPAEDAPPVAEDPGPAEDAPPLDEDLFVLPCPVACSTDADCHGGTTCIEVDDGAHACVSPSEGACEGATLAWVDPCGQPFGTALACTGGGCEDGACSAGECASVPDLILMKPLYTSQEGLMACVLDCATADAVCATTCAQTWAPGLGGTCAACWGVLMLCLVERCPSACVPDPVENACSTCSEEEDCRSDFFDCSGLGPP